MDIYPRETLQNCLLEYKNLNSNFFPKKLCGSSKCSPKKNPNFNFFGLVQKPSLVVLTCHLSLKASFVAPLGSCRGWGCRISVWRFCMASCSSCCSPCAIFIFAHCPKNRKKSCNNWAYNIVNKFIFGAVHKWRHPLRGRGIFQKVALLHKSF